MCCKCVVHVICSSVVGTDRKLQMLGQCPLDTLLADCKGIVALSATYCKVLVIKTNKMGSIGSGEEGKGTRRSCGR